MHAKAGICCNIMKLQVKYFHLTDSDALWSRWLFQCHVPTLYIKSFYQWWCLERQAIVTKAWIYQLPVIIFLSVIHEITGNSSNGTKVHFICFHLTDVNIQECGKMIVTMAQAYNFMCYIVNCRLCLRWMWLL